LEAAAGQAGEQPVDQLLERADGQAGLADLADRAQLVPVLAADLVKRALVASGETVLILDHRVQKQDWSRRQTRCWVSRTTRATGPPRRRVGFLTPQLAEEAKRRKFTADYKLRILWGRRACRTSGEVGALLPKGPVYVAPDVWRKQRKSGALKRLGPAGCLAGRQRDPEIAELNRLLERPEPELRRARHLRRRQEK